MKTYNVELKFITPFADSIPKDFDSSHATFRRDQNGLYYSARAVKAHMKDCAQQLESRLGIPGLKRKVGEHVEVYPEKIHLDKNKPDGSEIRIIQIL